MVPQDENSVAIIEKVYKQDGIDIRYPELTGIPDREVQDRINQSIQNTVFSLAAKQRQWPDSAELSRFEMTGTYQIKLNKNDLLSIRFENDIYPEHAAHGMTMVASMTLDLNSGKVYTLRDLFQRGSGYIYVLNEMISEQFKQRDIPMIEDFKGISVSQDFYLTPKNLVIYFQLYEYTPYYAGIVEMKIPYIKIINYINEDGPIARIFF